MLKIQKDRVSVSRDVLGVSEISTPIITTNFVILNVGVVKRRTLTFRILILDINAVSRLSRGVVDRGTREEEKMDGR